MVPSNRVLILPSDHDCGVTMHTNYAYNIGWPGTVYYRVRFNLNG